MTKLRPIENEVKSYIRNNMEKIIVQTSFVIVELTDEDCECGMKDCKKKIIHLNFLN